MESCTFLARWTAFSALILLPLLLSAQETTYKYGDVSNHDFEVMPVAGQETARAYIIYDYGEFYIDDRLQSVFMRHKRFRVLNESGLDYGNISIPYVSRNGIQEVNELKAHVYTKDANGRIQRRALRSRDFFRESQNSVYSVVKFAIPDLQPGSVVEFSYTIRTKNPVYIPSWTFQSSEPTLYSEMSAFIPNVLRYDPVYTGYVRLEPPNRTDYFGGDRMGIYFPREGGTRFRYVATDVPPLNPEAFTSNIDNYRATLRFNLSKIQYSGQNATNFTNTWAELGKTLMDDADVGGRLRPNRQMTALARSLVGDRTDSLEIATAIYDHVTKEFAWDERHSYWSARRPELLLTEKKGNSAELAFMLVNMLRAVGLNADPVLISTRDNGILLPVYPIPTQFNHVITRLTVGGKTHFLDVISPDLPFGLLDVPSVNERGFLFVKDAYHLIPITAPDSYKNRSVISLEMSADGSGSGTLESTFLGYQALAARKSIKKDGETAYFTDMLSSVNGLGIDTSRTTGLDTRDTPLLLNAEFRSSQLSDVTGDLLLLNPILIHRWAANPFTSESRVYPIDFAYPQESLLVVNIAIPEGYKVESLPESLRFGIGADANFSIVYGVTDIGLQVMCTYRIMKTQFLPDQYNALRAFFNRMVDAQQQQIVLKKL